MYSLQYFFPSFLPSFPPGRFEKREGQTKIAYSLKGDISVVARAMEKTQKKTFYERLFLKKLLILIYAFKS
jgi:hypothetical protein